MRNIYESFFAIVLILLCIPGLLAQSLTKQNLMISESNSNDSNISISFRNFTDGIFDEVSKSNIDVSVETYLILIDVMSNVKMDKKEITFSANRMSYENYYSYSDKYSGSEITLQVVRLASNDLIISKVNCCSCKILWALSSITLKCEVDYAIKCWVGIYTHISDKVSRWRVINKDRFVQLASFGVGSWCSIYNAHNIESKLFKQNLRPGIITTKVWI